MFIERSQIQIFKIIISKPRLNWQLSTKPRFWIPFLRFSNFHHLSSSRFLGKVGRIFKIRLIFFTTDWDTSHLEPRSALFWVLLQVELGPFLPVLEVSVLFQCGIHLANIDGGHIFGADHEPLDDFVEILTFLSEQKCLYQGPKSSTKELWAVIGYGLNIFEGVSCKNDISSSNHFEYHNSDGPLIPEVALRTDVAELGHVFGRVWRISEEALLVFNIGGASRINICVHQLLKVVTECDDGRINAPHSNVGLL